MPQGFVEPHVAINTLDGPRAGHLRAIRFPLATILLAALHRVFLHLCEAGSYVELGIIRPICPRLVRIVSQHNGLQLYGRSLFSGMTVLHKLFVRVHAPPCDRCDQKVVTNPCLTASCLVYDTPSILRPSLLNSVIIPPSFDS